MYAKYKNLYLFYKQKGGMINCLPIPIEQYRSYTIGSLSDFLIWLDKVLNLFKIPNNVINKIKSIDKVDESSIKWISEQVKPYKLQLKYTLFRGIYYVNFDTLYPTYLDME